MSKFMQIPFNQKLAKHPPHHNESTANVDKNNAGPIKLCMLDLNAGTFIVTGRQFPIGQSPSQRISADQILLLSKSNKPGISGK
jgi:hypothetical protein